MSDDYIEVHLDYILGEEMTEQTLTPLIMPAGKTCGMLEKARIAHEKFLIKQQNSDLEQAIECYVDAIKTNPSMGEAYYRLASLLLINGQITVEGALEQCKTALTIEPNNPNAHIYTGYFQCLKGDLNEAEKEFSVAISNTSHGNTARARLFLSKVLLNRIKMKSSSVKDVVKCLYYFLSGSMMIMWDCPSLKMFYKFLANDFSVFSYKTLGETFEKMKLFPSALEAYSKGLEKTSQGMFYQKMGDLSLECNDIASCKECYTRAYELNPLDREVLIKLVTLNQSYYPDDIDTTIDYYNSLLEFGIDTDKIYSELGHLYISKSDKINAVSAFKLALEQYPENPYYNNSLAFAYVKAELYDDAIEYYQKAIKLNPDSEWTSIVCHALGAIYAEIKDNFEAAEATFNAGMVLDPNNVDIQLSLGDLYMSKGDIDRAIKTYCDSISVDPLNYLTYAKTGLALWEKDYLEESIVAFHKSIELNPDFEISQNNLGVVYLDGMGDPKESMQYFKTAIKINPNYTLAYFNLARAYQATGDKAHSAEYYQMTLDLNKITEEMPEEDIRRRIYELFD